MVACRMRAATGFRSFANARTPSRSASNGMLPPPAVGSSTNMLAIFPPTASLRIAFSFVLGVYWKARPYPYGLRAEIFTCALCSVYSLLRKDRIPMNTDCMKKLIMIGIGRQQRC